MSWIVRREREREWSDARWGYLRTGTPSVDRQLTDAYYFLLPYFLLFLHAMLESTSAPTFSIRPLESEFPTPHPTRIARLGK